MQIDAWLTGTGAIGAVRLVMTGTALLTINEAEPVSLNPPASATETAMGYTSAGVAVGSSSRNWCEAEKFSTPAANGSVELESPDAANWTTFRIRLPLQ